MKIKILFAIIFTLGIFSPFTATAQLDGNPENWCRNGFFPHEKSNFNIGKLKAKRGERVYFYGDDGNCPNGKKCQQKSFLLAGNQVLVSRKFGDFSCVWFQPNKRAETVGWIPTTKIEGLNFLTERYKPWLGEWKFYGNSIKITQGEKEGDFNVILMSKEMLFGKVRVITFTLAKLIPEQRSAKIVSWNFPTAIAKLDWIW